VPDALNSEHFKDDAPREVFATLLVGLKIFMQQRRQELARRHEPSNVR